jgi:hypothetical protein
MLDFLQPKKVMHLSQKLSCRISKGLSVLTYYPPWVIQTHERVVGDVGKAGVAIDSVEDMKEFF